MRKTAIAFTLVMIVTMLTALNAALAVTDKPSLNLKKFTLDNGMVFLIVERHTTPQIACKLSIRAGSALEDSGKTGIAHLLEHMMFKGTKNFGTTDLKSDYRLQSKIDDAYMVIRRENDSRNPDKKLIEKKTKEMAILMAQARKIYVPNAFSINLSKNGVDGINAFTSNDETQYTAKVPSDMIEGWFSMVSEQIFEPAWREFYVEKEVVQREFAYRYVNSPQGAIWLDLNATAYNAHPYRNPVIGWKSDMERYSMQDAIDFHKKYYNPSNAVLVLSGDITLDKAKQLAKKYFSRYPAGPRAPERVTQEPTQFGTRRSVRFLKGARTPIIMMSFHTPQMGTRDFYALDVVTMLLSTGISSRLNQNIMAKGLAAAAWAHNPDKRYAGSMFLGGSPVEPKTDNGAPPTREAYSKACKDLEDLLLTEIGKLKTEPVTERELEKIKKLARRSHLEGLRNNAGLASAIATTEVMKGSDYLITYLENLEKVTPQEIMDTVKKHITLDNMTSVYVIPGGKPDKPPTAYNESRSVKSASGQFNPPEKKLENISSYPTPEGWKHPLSFKRTPEKIDYEKAEMFTANNVPVFFLENNELPFINFTVMVKAGTVDIADELQGLASVFNGSILQGGTQRLAPSEFALLLDENAIHMSVAIGEEETTFGISVLRDEWEKGLTILKELLLTPGFDEAVVKNVKKQIITALLRQNGSASKIASREAEIEQFKGHPYGKNPLKGLETIPAINAKDLAGFIKKYFTASRMTVAVSGDISGNQLKVDLEEFFDDFQKKSDHERNLDNPPPLKPALVLIDKPGQVQSLVVVRMGTVKRTHPDFWKISLLSQVFGGANSLVNQRLREDLGLVYSAYFYQGYKWNAGFLSGYIGCKADKTASAILETAKIMDSLVTNGVNKKDLEQKRLDTLNSFVFNVDTPQALVEAYARYQMRGEPLDTLDSIQNSFINVTKSEMDQLAKKYLNPNQALIFVVADKKTKTSKGKTLEQDLKKTAEKLGIDYREMEIK